MFKPELWQSHDRYKTIVTTIGRRLSHNNPKYSFDSYEEERQKLLSLDLDLLLDFIPGFYSESGRPAQHQAQILRSLILFALLFNKTKALTSLTAWVEVVLPTSISLTVLIGCTSTDELSPLGSHYDLMDRFWLGDRDNYFRSSLLPAGKNGKKPEKVTGPAEDLFHPCRIPFPAHSAAAAVGITLTLMPGGAGTATTIHGISAIPSTCSAAGTAGLRLDCHFS